MQDQTKTAFYMTILIFTLFAYFSCDYLYKNVYTHVDSLKDSILFIFLNFWILLFMLIFSGPVKNFFICLTKN